VERKNTNGFKRHKIVLGRFFRMTTQVTGGISRSNQIEYKNTMCIYAWTHKNVIDSQKLTQLNKQALYANSKKRFRVFDNNVTKIGLFVQPSKT
jgi:hypothetical protein